MDLRWGPVSQRPPEIFTGCHFSERYSGYAGCWHVEALDCIGFFTEMGKCCERTYWQIENSAWRNERNGTEVWVVWKYKRFLIQNVLVWLS